MKSPWNAVLVRLPIRLTVGLLLLISMGSVEAGSIAVNYLEKRKWTLTESRHFEIISDAKPSQVLILAEQLERFRGFALLLLGSKSTLNDGKLAIIATKGRKTWTSLGLSKEYISLVRSHSGGRKDQIFVNFDGFKGNSFRKGNTGRAAVLQSIAFDIFSDLSLNKDLPLWYRRGFSHYLASYSEPKDQIVLGAFESMGHRLASLFARNGRVRDIDARSMLTRRSFMNTVTGRALSNEERVRFSANAFVMVHYFYGNDERRKKLGQYLALLKAGESESSALQASFDLDFEQLSTELRNYITSPSYVRTYPREQVLALLELPGTAEYKNTPINRETFWQRSYPMISELGDNIVTYEEKKALYQKIKQHLPIQPGL